MRSYRRHACFVAAFLAGYALLGGVFRFTRPGGEVFPVSSWTLFLYVPNRVSEYDVELLSLAGERLPEPLALHRARGRVPGAGDISAAQLVQRMGRAHEAGDEARLAELRRLFERRWLGDASAPLEYRLVRHHYSPIERWRGRGVAGSERLRSFRFDGGES